MSELIIIRGIPGSGKSSLANRLVSLGNASGEEWHFFETDMYFTRRDGSYHYNKEQLQEAIKWCYSKTAESLLCGYTVVVAGVFTKHSSYEDYIKLGETMCAKVTVIVVENNHRTKSVHNVPDDVISRMRMNFEYNLR